MKKLICVSLIMILTLVLLAGCSGKNANPTPLTPVYANGVSPDYSSINNNTDDDTSSSDDTSTPDDGSATVDSTPDGYAVYSDNYVSFIHPDEFSEKLRLYLQDEVNGSAILIYEEAIGSTNVNFDTNAYTDITQDNFAESYADIIGSTENTTDVSVTKSTKDGYEITVVKYFEKDEEESADDTAEGTETEEASDPQAPAEPRSGIADIYIEKSSDVNFKEILIKVSAFEYPADSIPEDYTNFSEVVSKLVSSITVK